MILEHEQYARVINPTHPGFGEVVKIFSEEDGRCWCHFGFASTWKSGYIDKEDLSYLSVEVTDEEIKLFGTLLRIYETENPTNNEALNEIKKMAFRELQEKFGKQKTREELEVFCWWQMIRRSVPPLFVCVFVLESSTSFNCAIDICDKKSLFFDKQPNFNLKQTPRIC